MEIAPTLPESSRAPGLLEERIAELLKQFFPASIELAGFKRIKTSSTPAAVYRASLSGTAAQPAPASLLVKVIDPHWPEDPAGSDREVNFYARLHALLGLKSPSVYFAGCLPDTRQRVVILEDLSTYRTPRRTDRWTMAEALCFIRAYARLHSRPLPEDETLRAWLYPISAAGLNPEAVLRQAAALVEKGGWGSLPGLEPLVRRTLEIAPEMNTLPQALNHNDVFPPNILLPPDLSDEAVLVDWEMAGYGLPEMDLAFMFLQPFRSAAALDRQAILAAYWDARARLEGTIPDAHERLERQRFADAVWGLYLVRVAYRSVDRPFARGSAPDSYWQSMRGVLFEWLAALVY